jgi:DNA-binding CsgD family transcriptional regulator
MSGQAYKQALKSARISESPMAMVRSGDAGGPGKLLDRRAAFPAVVMVLQLVAAAFFVVDGVEDQFAQARRGFSLDMAMECVIALALLAGVILSSRYIVRLMRELRWKERSLARARGVLSDHIALRFQEWGLTPGEGEVALFALKGCDVAEIARLRGAAAGTIRSQLSQIYAKAGVSSQAMLVSLFIEDLLEPRPQH